ncbi:replication-relaxation family protein [Bacillus sp. SM2101]|uniref:replication-relaxation family protein n=1 Tax=Bacillus sp. SM2101 TaxID=2805366 RepID=UPI001BDE0344|nr:replication-relaxation family protein [Bacillus sp. SM2101]
MIKLDQLLDVSDYVSIKGGQYQQRLEMDKRYIQLIYFLYNSRILKATQLEAVFVNYLGYSLTSRALRKRLSKFVDYDVLASKQIDYGIGGPKFAIYRINEKGAEILNDIGLWPSGKTTKNLRDLFRKTRLEHYLATQEILIRTLIGAKDLAKHSDSNVEADYYSLESINPVSNPYHNKTSEHVLLLPDWIIKWRKQYLSIECDTGSENQKEITDKILAYIQMSKLNPEQQHTVLFCITDSSFPMRGTTAFNNRQRRVGNLKELAQETAGFLTSQLDIQVISMNRTQEISPRVFMLNPLTEENRTIRMKSFYRSLKQQKDYPYSKTSHFDEKMNEQIKTIENVIGFKPDYIVQESINRHKTINSAFIMLREGDVKSLGRLKRLSTEYSLLLLEKEGVKIDRVYGVYYDHEELINDVVPFKCATHVRFSSIKSLNRNAISTGVYQRLFSTKLEEIGYE